MTRRKCVFAPLLLMLFFLRSWAVFAQAPAISYPGPQTYTLHQTISALIPSNSGGAVPALRYGEVSTFAGSGLVGSTDGQGSAASFDQPRRLAVDAAGNIYVADFGNKLIRMITPAGLVSTIKTQGVSLNGIDGITVDAGNNLYFSDAGNNSIDRIGQFGNVTVIAGNGGYGAANGPGNKATFNYPIGIAVDKQGNIYVADYQNQLVRKIDINHNVTTLAGTGQVGSTDGPGTLASFSYPNGVGVDAAGNVYVADGSGRTIRKITPGGVVSTFAGTVQTNGFVFGDPQQVVIDALNNLYVTDGLQNQVIKITPSGIVSVLAGSGSKGKADGIGQAASFYGPVGITLGIDGSVYVADSFNNLIRKVSVFGYTIDKQLPAGLTFDASTGVISGTPTAASAATVYTITAYNNAGSSSTAVRIAVNSSVAVAGAPNISYSSPQTYIVNKTISPLLPANTGGAVPPNIYGQVTTFAGTGKAGVADGTSTAASFSAPLGLGADVAGDVFVGDYNNNTIRKITPAAVVTTYAGIAGTHGAANGIRTKSTFTLPQGVALDKNGNIYIADSFNQMIRKIGSNGVVTTVAGQTGVIGSADGTNATFNIPSGVAIDNNGNVYVADQGNNLIRKIAPNGMVSTLAGKAGVTGSANGTNATFNSPTGLAFDNARNLYVADAGNNLIRMITPAGLVSTFAGSGAAGASDGQGLAASFNHPNAIAIDDQGVMYIADQHNNIVRKITSGGNVTTLAGNGNSGSADGILKDATFSYPGSIAVDNLGNVFVGDVSTYLIRKITVTGYMIDKPLPPGLTFDPKTGAISGTPTAASPATDYTITACNSVGSSVSVVNITVDNVASVVGAPLINYQTPQTYTVNKTIATLMPVNTGGAVPATVYRNVTTLAGSGAFGAVNGPGSAATFHYPLGIAVDNSGNLYVSDQGNSLIRKITAGGVVTTLAGSGTKGNANGAGITASFYDPYGVAVDASGNVYVADEGNNLIRKITSAGVVSTFAGSGVVGASNGTGTAATFNHPYGVAVDPSGNVYVAEGANNLVRKITPAGVVTTFAGSGAKGSLNGTGAGASFYDPEGIAVDALGNVYVSDSGNEVIRKITPAGVVTTLAGSGAIGAANGPGPAASFNYPYGISVDITGNVYVVDQLGDLVRKISPAGIVSTFAGTGAQGSADGAGTAAGFYNPAGVAADIFGNVYTADSYNNKIRKISAGGYTIDKSLPPGLSFDPTTGSISGTPTAASPGTGYTITAYNAGGFGNAIVNITVTGSSANLPQPPNISYQTPQTYTVNVPVQPLPPTNTGGPIPANTYGQVTTFAGTGTQGNANGPALTAAFNRPAGLAFDASGNLFVSEIKGNYIRKITPAGIVSTFAGNGRDALANGPGSAASFSSPNQINFDRAGNLFVADEGNQLIRKIGPGGTVSSYAGTGAPGSADGTLTTATLTNPVGVAIDPSGLMYISDQGNGTVRKVDLAGQVSTFAVFNGGAAPPNSYQVLFYLTTDASGNLYFVNDDRLGSISPAGTTNTIAGSGNPTFADGIGTAASFYKPIGIARSTAGFIYLADGYNNRIRCVSPAGAVTTIAGEFGAGYSDGVGSTAAFSNPYGLALDASENFLYVADYGNNMVRKIAVTGYTIDKSLPNGLTFDPTTGVISGTPSISSPPETYTITAYNPGGSSTTTVNIQIVFDQSVVFGPIPAKTVCDADFDPGATGDAPITYTSSDPSVATVVSGKIHITGAGTSGIVASDGGSQAAQTLTVVAAITPTIGISPPAADTCAGKTMVFTAQVSGGGSQPSLQWQINGLNAGTNNQQFSAAGLNSGDKITCILTSSASCTTSNTVTSNTAVFTLDPPVLTSVKIIASDTGPICKGTAVTFTATAYSPDVFPTYLWKVNGVDAGDNEPTFTTALLNDGDVVTCMIISTGKCLIDAEATSNAIKISLNPQSQCIVEIPNTFTPNGDGVNDLWDITALQAYPGCTISIYNRGGLLVYNSINYPKPWDGTYNGKSLPVGTYYFVIDLKNGKKPLTGPVTIIK